MLRGQFSVGAEVRAFMELVIFLSYKKVLLLYREVAVLRCVFVIHVIFNSIPQILATITLQNMIIRVIIANYKAVRRILQNTQLLLTRKNTDILIHDVKNRDFLRSTKKYTFLLKNIKKISVKELKKHYFSFLN